MKTLILSLLAGGAAAVITLAPRGAANAYPGEDAVAVVPADGNWTLKQREDWLHSRIDKARDDGALDHHEFDRAKHALGNIHEDEERLRDHHDGQLTDNETADLEARLDAMADQIHWLHENSFRRPW